MEEFRVEFNKDYRTLDLDLALSWEHTASSVLEKAYHIGHC